MPTAVPIVRCHRPAHFKLLRSAHIMCMMHIVPCQLLSNYGRKHAVRTVYTVKAQWPPPPWHARTCCQQSGRGMHAARSTHADLCVHTQPCMQESDDAVASDLLALHPRCCQLFTCRLSAELSSAPHSHLATIVNTQCPPTSPPG
jgi:hypothetical protein